MQFIDNMDVTKETNKDKTLWVNKVAVQSEQSTTILVQYIKRKHEPSALN